MEYESLLNNARWDIIKSISKGKASASDLAKTTKSSLPNVSQQIKLLEAYDLIEFVKEEKKGLGKPRQLYQLKREICHVTYARHGQADKRFFSPTPYHQLMLNILFVPNLQDHQWLHKLMLTNEELLGLCSIAYLKSSENDVELFVLSEHLDVIRSKYSNIFLTYQGKTRKIILWSHNLNEVNDGLARKEHYFESLTSHYIILHDPKNHFEKIKRKV